ncbi:MAG: periplasmic heavy metal sensor [Deltaproteobacteria bacterium]|nr:periplasmic heavy metal sensor [Deltaproteobacteria bacterium]
MSSELGRLRLRAFALLAAIFLVGALAGVGAVRLAAPWRMPHPPPLGMELFERLGLTPDQRERAKEIFEKHRPELDAILAETLPRVREVQEVIDGEMRAILTPEQARRFEELRSRPPGHRPGMPPGIPGLPPLPMGGAGPGPLPPPHRPSPPSPPGP